MLLNVSRNALAAPLLAAALCCLLPGCALQRDTSCLPGAAERVDDPYLTPSNAEIRQARADAIAAEEMRRKGGGILYRPDGSASRPDAVEYAASPGALTLDIRASAELNLADGSPHALALCVYHLSDTAAFETLAGGGSEKLLSGERFDPSVLSARRLYIQPGRASVVELDRPERGRYVAIAAGYGGAPAVFVSPYGIQRYRQKVKERVAVLGVEVGKDVDMFAPRPMRVRVDLGSDAMLAWEVDGGEPYLVRTGPVARPGEM